jgi:glycerophosphoryl diester phosphodiesterase
VVTVYGHRGARAEAPENTIPGFDHALRLGVTALEFDVRLSADDRLVVIHDETVDRTTDGTGRVADLTLDQLRALDARGPHDAWPERVAIPTLDEVLATVGAASRALQIEVKRDAPDRMRRVCAGIAHAVHDRGLEERSVVSSFEPAALEHVRSMAPHLRRAFITSRDAAAGIETARRLGCAQLCLQLAIVSRPVVEEAHRHGFEVCGWVGNTPEELRDLAAAGVDCLTTDRPSVALRWSREHAI